MHSTRLPRKVMADLAGKPMLQQIVERVQGSRQLDELVLATSDLVADGPIAELGRRLDVTVFRGSEHDVLDRYYQAARSCGADTIVRLTADNPFVGADLVDWTIRRFHEEEADYVDTWASRTIATGLTVEVLTSAALEAAWTGDNDLSSREHVTSYVIRHPERFRVVHLDHEQWGGGLRLTVDTVEDLALARDLYARLGGANFTVEEAVAAARACATG
jgi:spore coat polysaccharide biosynthesis protein SpsF (cytidylyltransferase family)